jgi:hypothetical protein
MGLVSCPSLAVKWCLHGWLLLCLSTGYVKQDWYHVCVPLQATHGTGGETMIISHQVLALRVIVLEDWVGSMMTLDQLSGYPTCTTAWILYYHSQNNPLEYSCLACVQLPLFIYGTGGHFHPSSFCGPVSETCAFIRWHGSSSPHLSWLHR